MKKLIASMSFILIGIFFSCQKSSIQIKPEILTAQYEIVSNGEFEKGYKVLIEIIDLNENAEIQQIVLNKRLFKVKELITSKSGILVIEGYLPLQSKMIHDFSPPKPDSRPDGIIFEIEGIDYFYKIKFKLK